MQRWQATIHNLHELDRVEHANAADQQRKKNHLSVQIFGKSAHAIDHNEHHAHKQQCRHPCQHGVAGHRPPTPLHQALRSGVGDGKSDQRTPQGRLVPKKTHGTEPIGDGCCQCEGVVDHAHHTPGGAALQQLQHIGQAQQQVAQGEKIHAHGVAVQTLERKAGFIAQVMEHTGEARTVEDVTSQALSFAEVKALASGNPIVIEKAGVDAQVARLVALKSVYMSDRCKDSAQIRFDQDSIAHKKRLVQSLSLDLQNIGNTNEVTISGVCIRDAAVAGKEIMKSMALAADAVKAGRRKIDLFKVGNAMLVYEDYGHKQLRVRIGGEMAYEVRLPYGAENIASALRSGVIECQLREQLDREIKRVAELEVSIRAMQERMKKPFEHERALEEALERQAEIDSHLEVDAQDKSLVSFEESSD